MKMAAVMEEGINSGSWYHCLPIRIYHWKWEEDCTAVMCEVVCCMEVKPGLEEKKLRWHISGQRWQWSYGCVVWSYKIEFQVKGWERET